MTLTMIMMTLAIAPITALIAPTMAETMAPCRTNNGSVSKCWRKESKDVP